MKNLCLAIPFMYCFPFLLKAQSSDEYHFKIFLGKLEWRFYKECNINDTIAVYDLDGNYYGDSIIHHNACGYIAEQKLIQAPFSWKDKDLNASFMVYDPMSQHELVVLSHRVLMTCGNGPCNRIISEGVDVLTEDAKKIMKGINSSCSLVFEIKFLDATGSMKKFTMDLLILAKDK